MVKSLFYFDLGTERTFLNTISSFLIDIKKLESERLALRNEYDRDPNFDNPALFTTRAKHMEQMLLLGIVSEYLIKVTLIKNNFIINSLSKKAQYDSIFSSKLAALRTAGYSASMPLVEEIKSLAETNVIGSLTERTIEFEECIQIFNKIIEGKNPPYFGQNPLSYSVSNEVTKEFYGQIITYDSAFDTLRKVRNNYGHVPEAKYEENGIVPFLYDFLVFVAKKEFPAFFSDLKNFRDS